MFCQNYTFSCDRQQGDDKAKWGATDWSSRGIVTAPMESGSDNAEDLLAKEMSKINMQERSAAYEDVHGVAGVENDPPEIPRHLHELNQEIRKQTTSTYLLAEASSPEYVENREFRLLFLRADSFDPRKAARRFMKYFDTKLWLFGAEKLTKDITQADLQPEDMKFLATAVLRLPEHRNGKGYISVLYNNKPVQRRPEITWTILKIRHSFPLGTRASHLCVYGPQAAFMMSAKVKLMPRRIRVRSRIHFGSDMECQYQLKTFGINTNCFPVDHNGNLNLSFHRRWLEEQRVIDGDHAPAALVEDKGSMCDATTTSRRIEESTGGKVTKKAEDFQLAGAPITKEGNSGMAGSAEVAPHLLNGSGTEHVSPGQKDVLFGRGRPLQEHPGNIYVRKLVELYTSEFNSASRFEKTLIAARIVQTIKSSGGRFMKLNGGGDDSWIEVDDTVAHRKVGQIFRTRRHKTKGPLTQTS